MGVPGLASSLSKLTIYQPVSFVTDGILYIDGMNFVGGIATIARMKRSTKADFKSRAVRHVQARISVVKTLQWKKIYMFFDAYFPTEKVDIKVRRKKYGLWTKPHLSAMSEILDYIINSEPSIELVFSGLEGETAIAQHIYENQEDKRSRRFILSDDSDIYTYDLPLKHLIFGVPQNQLAHSKVRSIGMLRLSTVWDSISKTDRIKLPLEYIPESVFNPTFPIRTKVQDLNLIASHNQLIVFLPPFVTPELTGTHEIGLLYRKARYRIILDEFFHGRDIIITECVERDYDIVKKTELKATAEEFSKVLKDLMNLPIETLVYNELKRVQKHIAFSNKELNSIYAFVMDLARGKCDTGMAPSFRTFQAKALLETFLETISSFILFVQIDRDIRRFTQISEFQLCKYIA